MIRRDYFARQASTLLRLATLTRDARQSARLAIKAAELKDRLDAAPAEDLSAHPPGVERRLGNTGPET